jgi:hypothetical protein
VASNQLDYSGKRHARITTSMRKLPKTMRLVLLELRWRIPDGETKHVSNATLASATGLSEASVSVYVRLLAGETVAVKGEQRQPPQHRFIARQRRTDSPGYEITMLPPPELRPRVTPTPAPQVVQMEFEIAPVAVEPNVCAGSLDDPSSHAADLGIRTPETAAEKGSLDDPSILHESMPTQQQPDERGGSTGGDHQTLPPYPNCFEALAARLAARFPSYPEPFIQSGIEKLRSRRDVQAGRTSLEAVLYSCLRENKPIYSQAELDARSLAYQESCYDRAAPAPARSGRGAAPDRDRRASGRRGAAPPPRSCIEQPPPDFACIDDLGPGYTLDELLRGVRAGSVSGRSGST